MKTRRWWITITPVRDEKFIAWATETQPPRNASIDTMFLFPGEVHFASGRTAVEARDRLEASLPK